MVKKPRVIASDSGAVTPSEFCHADSARAGQTGQNHRPNGLGCLVSVRIPLRTINPTNAREHWSVRSKRARYERDMVLWSLVGLPRPRLPLVVLLTRQSPRRMDDDGAIASQKSVRDEVASWLGIDDGDPRIAWEYDQAKSKEYGVLIEIRGR